MHRSEDRAAGAVYEYNKFLNEEAIQVLVLQHRCTINLNS